MTSTKLEISQVINEVHDLQFDMQQWIRGAIDQDYSLITNRQAVDLTVISSKGVYQTKQEFNNRYKLYYGKYPDGTLSADILRTKRISDQRVLVVYKQFSTMNNHTTKRITTAIFQFNTNNKNDAEWQHVHVSMVQEE